MQRPLIVLCCLLLCGGGVLCQAALARTQCESNIPGTRPAAEKTDSNGDLAAAPAHAAETKSARIDDATAVAGGGSAAAGGGDETSANLPGSATSGGRKHGLRWQSLLPGVIK